MQRVLRRKISTHKVSRTNQHVKAHKQNQLHDEKHEYTIFTKREINLQQVSRTKTSTQLVP